MQQSILVRPIELNDIPETAELLSTAFYEGSWLGWASPILRMGIYQDLKTRYLSPPSHHVCLVGLQKIPHSAAPVVVGTVEVTVRPLLSWNTLGMPVPYLSNLAVAQPFRRQGVGRQLLLACEPIVRHWRYDSLYLHVRGENQAARGLYFSLGYRRQTDAMPLWTRLMGQPPQLLLCKSLAIAPSK